MREYSSFRPNQRFMNDSVEFVAETDPRLMLSSIVHDFNNLLTPIVNILEDLQGRGAGTPRQLKKIDGAIYCAFRAKLLARQLLDFANPRLARLQRVDIPGLLEMLEPVFASVLSPGIDLSTEIGDNLPPAFIDPQLVERALVNLIFNARDAMPDGGNVTIAAAFELPLASREAPEWMIRLSVADSGIGMGDETLMNAGLPNFTTKTNGRGLGLASVRQAMESLGGGLSITSTPRQGTTIDLWLPVMSACRAD